MKTFIARIKLIYLLPIFALFSCSKAHDGVIGKYSVFEINKDVYSPKQGWSTVETPVTHFIEFEDNGSFIEIIDSVACTMEDGVYTYEGRTFKPNDFDSNGLITFKGNWQLVNDFGEYKLWSNYKKKQSGLRLVKCNYDEGFSVPLIIEPTSENGKPYNNPIRSYRTRRIGRPDTSDTRIYIHLENYPSRMRICEYDIQLNEEYDGPVTIGETESFLLKEGGQWKLDRSPNTTMYFSYNSDLKTPTTWQSSADGFHPSFGEFYVTGVGTFKMFYRDREYNYVTSKYLGSFIFLSASEFKNVEGGDSKFERVVN